jgi:hypothetical protein
VKDHVNTSRTDQAVEAAQDPHQLAIHPLEALKPASQVLEDEAIGRKHERDMCERHLLFIPTDSLSASKNHSHFRKRSVT